MNNVWLSVIKYIFWALPILFGLHTWLYSKFPKYYFFIVRLFSKWRDTKWEINVEYKLESVPDAYSKIEAVMKETFKGERFKRTVNMVDKKVYECAFFLMTVSDDSNMGVLSEKKVTLRIAQLNVTLNSAEEKLQNFRELFNEIERSLRPIDKGYNLDVFFKKGKNPFFGLMVQRLGKENVLHFECFFPIDAIVPNNGSTDTKKHLLRIFKEKLCINESSFDKIEQTAKRALLFK